MAGGLSRYGWDVSFMVMGFAGAAWLFLLAVERGRTLYAYLSGAIAALCLYSYLAAQVCILSLLLFVVVEWLVQRNRLLFRIGTAFGVGLVSVAFPLLCYYLSDSQSVGVRSSELSVFKHPDAFLVIANNIWRHALMFFAHGGTYARDNYPGLPMLDSLTGAMLITGWIVSTKQAKTPAIRLAILTFAVNLIPGVFSVSQEGAPYVYRTAAVMIPAFMISGVGMHWLKSRAEAHWPSNRVAAVAWLLVLSAASLIGWRSNVWSVFQGRLLFPSYPALLLALNAGLEWAAIVPWRRRLASASLMSLFGLFFAYFATEFWLAAVDPVNPLTIEHMPYKIDMNVR